MKFIKREKIKSGDEHEIYIYGFTRREVLAIKKSLQGYIDILPTNIEYTTTKDLIRQMLINISQGFYEKENSNI